MGEREIRWPTVSEDEEAVRFALTLLAGYYRPERRAAVADRLLEVMEDLHRKEGREPPSWIAALRKEVG
jgi:hypothetical protein